MTVGSPHPLVVHYVNHRRQGGQQPRVFVPIDHQLELIVQQVVQGEGSKMLGRPSKVQPLDQLRRGLGPTLHFSLAVPDFILLVGVRAHRVVQQIPPLLQPAVQPPLVLKPQHALAQQIAVQGVQHLVLATPAELTIFIVLHDAEGVPDGKWVETRFTAAQVEDPATVLNHLHSCVQAEEPAEKFQGGEQVNHGDQRGGVGVQAGLQLHAVLVIFVQNAIVLLELPNLEPRPLQIW
mmetsp:Transcript_108458/g.248585  ORF Transcript_108458/g.248585 Transcript_108458/m.248585 type:complete len:236 (+) Transcript_108458:287-994(+)